MMSSFIVTFYSLGMTLLLFCLVEATFPKSLSSILLITLFICMFVLTTQVRMLNYDMRYDLDGWFWKCF